MKRCKVVDCQSINRVTYLCTESFTENDKSGQCITYRQDKKYLDLQFHQYIRGDLQAKGYVPETQEMVDTAKSLRHTPSRKAGEEETTIPRIRSELAEGVEPLEGFTYRITEVQTEQKTAVQGFVGHRVAFEPTTRKKDDDSVYATMLWHRELAGVASKLGSFMAAFLDFLGDEDLAFETDNWIGCVVRIVKWAPRNREIEVIEGKKE